MMRNLQIEVGTSKPFYCLDIDQHQYVTPNTQWGYFWEVVKEHRLIEKTYNFWTPKSSFDNNKNIMEYAV